MQSLMKILYGIIYVEGRKKDPELRILNTSIYLKI